MTNEEALEKARASVLAVNESLDMLEQKTAELVQQCKGIVTRMNAVEQKLEQIEKMHADVQRIMSGKK
ncbi:TPA: hypothetical protein JLH41_004010 [Escherichia coli]|nr:hypothetical protein [Escherichia coli]HAW4079027.1 hypothetical protein [Escherichia coli]